MTELGIQRSAMRLDPTTGDWVLFAPSRLLRPQEFRPHRPAALREATPDRKCPFCPGAEQLTPPEVYREPPSNGSSEWLVRVVPNRFPALQVEESPRRVTDGPGFERMGGCGAHEVIIESPVHSTPLALQPIDQIERVLRAARSRYRDLMQDQRMQAIVVFENYGTNAGTTLSHPHWQVIATAVVPPLLRLKHRIATEYFDRTGDCLYCAMTRRELDASERVVVANDAFAAVVPYASHIPFELWILPQRHVPSFGDVADHELRPLAEILRTSLQSLHACLEDPDYNMTIDSVARGDEHKAYFLWHIRVLPRLAPQSGFELGSGMSVNTVLPEEAAAYLRASDLAAAAERANR